MGVLDDRANLKGKRAVVVGGGAGIGQAISLSLAAAGVDLAICDIQADPLAATCEEVRSFGRQVISLVADAVQSEQLLEFYSLVGSSGQQADIVVNVVGGVTLQRFMERSPEACADDIQRNYGYVIESCRRAIPLLRRSGRGGSIINFATIEAFRGAATAAVYAGAKAALVNFSRALAGELGPERIRINLIAPDTTPSEGNSRAMGPELVADLSKLPQAWVDAGSNMYVPMQAHPTPEDLANAVLFLASDLSRSITGTTLHVDGGTWAVSGFMRWPHDGSILPAPMGANTLRKLFG